jgi:hypothetical protein
MFPEISALRCARICDGSRICGSRICGSRINRPGRRQQKKLFTKRLISVSLVAFVGCLRWLPSFTSWIWSLRGVNLHWLSGGCKSERDEIFSKSHGFSLLTHSDFELEFEPLVWANYFVSILSRRGVLAAIPLRDFCKEASSFRTYEQVDESGDLSWTVSIFDGYKVVGILYPLKIRFEICGDFALKDI